MKKITAILVLAVATTAVLIGCQKEDVQKEIKTKEATEASNERWIIDARCPIDDYYTTSYFDLGYHLCGDAAVGPQYGNIDERLNCLPEYFEKCEEASFGLSIAHYTTEQPNINGDPNPLDDGVFTEAEKLALIASIQQKAQYQIDNNYPGYRIVSYDTEFVYALCGGCPDAITILCTVQIAKECKTRL